MIAGVWMAEKWGRLHQEFTMIILLGDGYATLFSHTHVSGIIMWYRF
jgi:hypothetical protein